MAVLIILLTIGIFALYYCYRQVFWIRRSATNQAAVVPSGEQYTVRKQQILDMIHAAEAIPCESVSIRSHDGLTLYGRYYETTPGAPLQIQFHGYRSNPFRDFCGGLQLALDSGCNVLLVSQRGHERSEGRCLTFGILERQDCLCWVDYACKRFGGQTPIFLAGISMGAATVMMASELALPPNVAGIIADCGYTSPKAIIRKVMQDMHYPVSMMYPLVRLAGRIFGGFDIESASAVDALRRCRVPVLLIHGEDDRFVPCEMSRENYAACASEKTLVTIPEAGHGICYLVDEQTYSREVQAFLAKCLN